MRLRRGVAAALCIGAVIAACTPTTSTPAGPRAPRISSFAAVGGPFVAPTTVPVAWRVSDANNDTLTCRIDVGADGTWEETVSECDRGTGVGSRLVELPEGPTSVRFEVSDGTFTTTATVIVVVEPDVNPDLAYNIETRPLAPIDPAVQAAFDAAATRWSAAVVRGVPDAEITLSPGQCLDAEPGATLEVDDLVITVEITPIDGEGGVLGSAGPCVVSAEDGLTRVGLMQFDSADVSEMLTGGTFAAVVEHEMGHVLGIGTLWDAPRSLLAGAGGTNPRFTGGRAVAEYSTLGGTATAVPVENTGGPGTADAHWREATFGNELMTGWISPTSNPLSAMSISSLGDLGYAVDRSTADAYSLPTLPSAMDAARPAAGAVDTTRMGRPPITVQ